MLCHLFCQRKLISCHQAWPKDTVTMPSYSRSQTTPICLERPSFHHELLTDVYFETGAGSDRMFALLAPTVSTAVFGVLFLHAALSVSPHIRSHDLAIDRENNGLHKLTRHARHAVICSNNWLAGIFYGPCNADWIPGILNIVLGAGLWACGLRH